MGGCLEVGFFWGFLWGLLEVFQVFGSFFFLLWGFRDVWKFFFFFGGGRVEGEMGGWGGGKDAQMKYRALGNATNIKLIFLNL